MATAEFSKFADIFSAALSQHCLSGFEIQIYLKWQIDGETVADFIFLGSKITADGDCSNGIKRRLLLGRKDMTNLSSVAQSCPTVCDPMNCSTPGLAVHHQLLEFTQTHVHRVGDDIQPCHPLSSPSPPAPNPSQHHSLFQ